MIIEDIAKITNFSTWPSHYDIGQIKLSVEPRTFFLLVVDKRAGGRLDGKLQPLLVYICEEIYLAWLCHF